MQLNRRATSSQYQVLLCIRVHEVVANAKFCVRDHDHDHERTHQTSISRTLEASCVRLTGYGLEPQLAAMPASTSRVTDQS